jgi:hypothetical protein
MQSLEPKGELRHRQTALTRDGALATGSPITNFLRAPKLYEYQLRSNLLLADHDRALAFRDALAFEMRAFSTLLGRSADSINQDIAVSLGVIDASGIVGAKEKDSFGGSVRSQMKEELSPEKRYVGTFAWASLFSHGSILALKELSEATTGATNDLLLKATEDAHGNDLLYHACWLVLWFAGQLHEEIGVGVPDLDRISKNIISCNNRLGIVSAAQEEAIEKLRQERRK